MYLTGFPRIIVNMSLALATFMIVLDYSIANVSIPYISGDLAVSVDQGTYVITSFAVGNAIVLALTGWLTKRIGAIKLLCASILLFTLFSWACGAAVNLPMLVICRFIQGAVSGPLIPLSQSLTVSCNPPEKQNSALGIWATIIITAPIAGPMLGGWISYDYTWPWIFYINIPVGIICSLLIWTYLKDRKTPIEKGPFDYIGLIFLIIAVGCLQIFLDKGEQYDWFRSNLMCTLIISSIIAFTLLIIWELSHPTPLLELRLFKTKSFFASIIFVFVGYAIYFGSVVLVPLWLQTNMGYTSVWAGFAVAPIGIAPALFGFFTPKIYTRYGIRFTIFLCYTLFALSCFFTAFFDTDVDIWHIGFSRFLLGCAFVFFMTPILALSMQDLPQEKLPSGTGIFHFVRAMSGAIGTSVFTTMWTRRSAFHHERVGSAINLSPPDTSQGLALLNNSLNNQAAILAINDCFYFMGWTLLALLLFLPLAKRKAASAAPKEMLTDE